VLAWNTVENDPIDGALRERLARWIGDLLASGAPGQVTLASEPGHPGVGLRSTFDRNWRVLVCREGTARFLVMRGGAPDVVQLRPGDLLAIAPRAWLTAAPGPADAYTSLSAVFMRDRTRCLSVRCAPVRPGRARDLSRLAVEAVEVRRTLDGEARSWCAGLARERDRRCEEYRRHLGALVLARFGDLVAAPSSPEPAASAKAAWARACRLAEERCDRPLGRREAARALGMHPSHLSRLFQRFARTGFHGWLQRLRLERAASLLDDQALTLAEIARRCGFGGAHQLIRAFRREYGATPRRWRR
jgi:AraC-like DNA-binding protein